jgi:hypothetical protein
MSEYGQTFEQSSESKGRSSKTSKLAIYFDTTLNQHKNTPSDRIVSSSVPILQLLASAYQKNSDCQKLV